MKLAFSGEGRYPEFDDGYKLYCSRRRGKPSMTEQQYKKAVKLYCRALSSRLIDNGIVDLPTGLGSISAITLTRKPQYRGNKFIGLGKKDWESGQYDGSFKTFGITFLPRHTKEHNLRCFGFVANRRLFQRMKEMYLSDNCSWIPLRFKDNMI